MMKVASSDNNKRRRTLGNENGHEGTLLLSDLPSGILAHAASYLAAPSKALFAVALDKKDSAALPSDAAAPVRAAPLLLVTNGVF